MSERVVPGGVGALVALGAADALWAVLTAGSAVPAASAVFTCPPADARAGYVVLGARVVVAAVRADDGRWGVSEVEVRQAALGLNSVEMDGCDLVRIGPFGGATKQGSAGGTLLGWRGRIAEELRGTAGRGRAAQCGEDRLCHLAGIDWRRVLVERAVEGVGRSWWLPRAVVRLLDAAGHAETQWLQAAQARQASSAAEPPSRHRQPQATDSRQATGPDVPIVPLRPYGGELAGQLYSVLSRKPGMSGKVAGWVCAVCRTAAAAVLDHCHEHGYVRAPVCTSCNILERPDHLYRNDIRVAGRYMRLFGTGAAGWLGHWHRCPGCRTRSVLPLPHLAAWTAHTASRTLRPTHREGRTRKPCGVLRVSWTGSQNAPRSCLLTVAVDFCPSGEHRVLAQVPYREAADRFRAWLAETAPALAAAAGPDRLDGLPARPRPVIADTGGEGLSLF
ncbi:endonuclease domain-containing protein [Streptomyces sp. NPDC127051]|uniref:endonuclease domain-containing protein n=1 Tax=Streptomyces sp. NPDC127051 TaxID=3347119 RepID=UPI003659FC2D